MNRLLLLVLLLLNLISPLLSNSSCEVAPPIIDIADGISETTTVSAILDATINKSGVLYLTNCGYLCDLMSIESESAFDDNLHTLFAAGRSDNSSWSSQMNSRGYIKKGGESGVQSKFYEVKEGYEFGSSAPSAPRRNKWPGHFSSLPSSTVPSLDRMFEELEDLKNLLTSEVFAPYLNSDSKITNDPLLQPEDWEQGRSIDLVRLFNYLPCDDSSDLPELGSSPHTDWGLITIILQPPSSPTALELHHPKTQTWEPVPPIPNTVVVNAGDFLELLSYVNHDSRSTFKSPLHRVQHCGANGGARKSVVFFSYPRPEMSLKLIQNDIVEKIKSGKTDDHNTLLGEDYSKYSTFGEWIDEKWSGVTVQT